MRWPRPDVEESMKAARAWHAATCPAQGSRMGGSAAAVDGESREPSSRRFATGERLAAVGLPREEMDATDSGT